MNDRKKVWRILLVDDDDLVRKAFVRMFAELDSFEIVTLASGREAIALLESDHAFYAIIADFLMPGIDGCELLQAARLRWPTIRRFLFTASEDNCRVQRCLLGDPEAALIPKPWEKFQILAALQQPAASHMNALVG